MQRFGMRPAMVLALALGLGPWLRAADFEVTAAEAAPPEEVAAPVRDALSPSRLSVSRAGAIVAEFWLRKELPAKAAPSDVLGVSFGSLEPGVLVGVVRLGQPWREYKDLAVAPGVYTMRYAVRPADGNHMGVSTFSDFLLLVPAAGDTAVELAGTREELYERSMAATGQPHPATLALFPVWDEIAGPTVVVNDEGQPMLAVRLGELTLGLVIEGHGRH